MSRLFKSYKKFHIFLLALSSFLYIFFALRAIPYNRFNNDIALQTMVTVNLLNSSSYNTCTNAELDLFGMKLPTNIFQGYTYQMQGYLLIPFCLLMGTSIYSVFSLTVLTGLLYLLILYFLLKYTFNETTSLLTVLFLAANPSYIHYSTNAFMSTEPFINLMFAVFLLFVFLALHGKKSLLLPAAWALGAGFSFKLSIFSRIAALFAIYPIMFRGTLKKLLAASGYVLRIFTISAFLLGAGLFIAFNISGQDKTNNVFDIFYKCLIKNELSFGDVHNHALAANIRTRLLQYKRFFTDKSYDCNVELRYYLQISDRLSDDIPLYLMLFFILINLYTAAAAYKKDRIFSIRIISVYLYFLVLFLFSFFSPGWIRAYQLSCMYPIQQLSAALFINIICMKSSRLVINRYISAALIIYLMGLNFAGSFYAESVSKLSDMRVKTAYNMQSLYYQLDSLGINTLILPDKLFKPELIFLSGGRFNLTGNFDSPIYHLPDDTEEALSFMRSVMSEFMASTADEALFIIYRFPPFDENMKYFKSSLYAVLNSYGLKYGAVKEIKGRFGRTVFEILKISRPGGHG